jgi:hypothetical protein
MLNKHQLLVTRPMVLLLDRIIIKNYKYTSEVLNYNNTFNEKAQPELDRWSFVAKVFSYDGFQSRSKKY